MNIEDSEEWSTFYQLWCSMQYLLPSQRREPDEEAADDAIMLAFAVLSEFDIEEVVDAIHKHMKNSRWMATPAEIISNIVGQIPSDEAMAGLLRAADTPIGVYMRSFIGTHDLQRMNDHDLINWVKCNSDRINSFIERAQVGDYTMREMRMIVGAGCDPSNRLCRGLSGPRLKYRSAVRVAVAKLKQEQLEASNDSGYVELSDADKAEGRKHLDELLKAFGK